MPATSANVKITPRKNKKSRTFLRLSHTAILEYILVFLQFIYICHSFICHSNIEMI